MKTRLLIIIGILIFVAMGVFFILSVMNYDTYLNNLEKERKLSAGSSSPYCPPCFLHVSQNYEITGIISTVATFYILQDNLMKEDFDLEKIRYINQINSCLELKQEYELIKQYDSVLEHSDLYIKALEDRAKEIVKPPVKCEF